VRIQPRGETGTNVREEPSRLRDLPAEDDLVRAGEFLRDAVPLKDLTPAARHSVRVRLRDSLSNARPGLRRRPPWRFALRPTLVVMVALLSASVGGAAMYSVIATRRFAPAAAPPEDAPVGDAIHPKRPRRTRAITPDTVTSQPDPPAAQLASAAAPPPIEPEPSSAVRPAPAPAAQSRTAPAAGHLPAGPPPAPTAAPTRLDAPLVAGPATRPPAPMVAFAAPPAPEPPTHLALAPPPMPAPPIAALARQPAAVMPTVTPTRTPAPTPTPTTTTSAPPSENALLADAIRVLRGGGGPDAALALLDQHQARFPRSALGPEAAALRIEALLKVGRTSAALAALDRFPLHDAPGGDAWRVARGELRAKVGRWREAEADFAEALTVRLDGARGDLAERALWGRAVARAHLGDAAGADADYALYLQRFPRGRFAAQARRLSPLNASNEPEAR